MRERRWLTWGGAAVCAIAVGLAPLGAQGTCTGCDSTRSHVFPALGLRAGTPQKVSFALGVVTGVEWQKYGSERSRDFAFFIEPGLGAARLSAAYIKGIGSMGSGYGVAVTAMRTWSQPWTLAPNTTYVGGELLILPLFLAGPRIGLFRRMTGSALSGHWFLVADFGLGL